MGTVESDCLVLALLQFVMVFKTTAANSQFALIENRRDAGTSSDANTLRLVHAVFRHGERTPADTYPLDPYVNSTWEPFGWGQLTNNGKRAQYKLGMFIRKRYAGFLNEAYSPDSATFISTDVDRAKMSAQLVAAAVYKPVGVQKWNKHLDWLPVPIQSEPLNDDRLLLVRIRCPRYHEERQRIMESAEVLEELKTYEYLYKYLSTHTGMSVRDPDDVQSIYSTLKAESDYGVQLPSWTSKVYPAQLARITSRSFVLNAYSTEMRRLKGGPLLRKILEDSRDRIAGRSSHQLYAYAGHDSTVTNLLIALGVWDQQIPTYNILALLELHETIGGQFYFKVYLRNESSTEPYRLQIPKCKDDLCTLEHVTKLTVDVVPLDLAEECTTNNSNFSNLKITDRGP